MKALNWNIPWISPPTKKSNYGFHRNQWKTDAIKAVLYLQTELQLTSIRNFQLSKKNPQSRESLYAKYLWEKHQRPRQYSCRNITFSASAGKEVGWGGGTLRITVAWRKNQKESFFFTQKSISYIWCKYFDLT